MVTRCFLYRHGYPRYPYRKIAPKENEPLKAWESERILHESTEDPKYLQTLIAKSRHFPKTLAVVDLNNMIDVLLVV